MTTPCSKLLEDHTTQAHKLVDEARARIHRMLPSPKDADTFDLGMGLALHELLRFIRAVRASYGESVMIETVGALRDSLAREHEYQKAKQSLTAT